MVEFKRKKGESFESFLRRFNKTLIRSRKLNEVRNRRYLVPKKNKNKQKQYALVSMKIKEKMTKIIQDQPEDSTYDEILRELAFARMIDRGLEDSRAGRTMSNEEMRHRIRTWQK